MLCYSGPTTTDTYADKKCEAPYNVQGSYYVAGDHACVISTQPDGRALRHPSPEKPRTNIELAMVVMICFNIPFGIVAMVLSVKSNKDYDEGSYHSARIKGKISLAFSIAGIITTISIVLLTIFWPIITGQT
jgi:hypothetical protein